jgi:hypothetical protein
MEIQPFKMALFSKYFFRSNSLEKGKVYIMMEKNISENIGMQKLSDILKIIN